MEKKNQTITYVLKKKKTNEKKKETSHIRRSHAETNDSFVWEKLNNMTYMWGGGGGGQNKNQKKKRKHELCEKWHVEESFFLLFIYLLFKSPPFSIPKKKIKEQCHNRLDFCILSDSIAHFMLLKGNRMWRSRHEETRSTLFRFAFLPEKWSFWSKTQ